LPSLPSSVGKTNILEQFVNRRFSQTYKATIGADFLVKDVQIGDVQATLQVGV
jgi:Ras-related protein Rab-7A